jgi:hypothetical protein
MIRVSDIVGTWKLVDAKAFDADGNALPPPYGGDEVMGRLTFNDRGRMVSVICDSRLEVPPGEQREYTSYCGTYRLEGGQLITRVDAAADDARMGTDQVRDVQFEGEVMVLRPPLKPYGARVEQRELRWEKISDE